MASGNEYGKRGESEGSRTSGLQSDRRSNQLNYASAKRPLLSWSALDLYPKPWPRTVEFGHIANFDTPRGSNKGAADCIQRLRAVL
jgi:hypothetical protein